MNMMKDYQPWPELPYQEFKSTSYLLHMGIQAIGKLKLNTPFEPHWANVALWITSQGLTTGLIPYEKGAFTIDLDLINHHVVCNASWGSASRFKIASMSVAEFTRMLFNTLHGIGVDLSINMMPQEIANPIPFDKDSEVRAYNPDLANAWWRILVSSYQVMQRYHAKFTGISPAIGLMWGTLDLRDARYQGAHLPLTEPNTDFIRRNAMDVPQVEVGWWSGNDQYTRPAYFSFIYPKPERIEHAKPKPSAARWDNTLGEFLIDYDDIRKAKNPDADLLAFFESTYQIEAERAGWDPELLGEGKPV